MDIFIFDVDNTLTPPRQKILPENLNLFNKFVQAKKVYLVSGSDREKLKWQLTNNTLTNVAGVFTCLGNCFHIDEKLIYENSFEQLNQKEFRSDIEEFIANSKTPIKTANHVEERVRMINISTIGRAATIEQRKIYHEFDNIECERKKFTNFLKQKYPELDVSIGGEISIDISVKGYNKSQIINHIDKQANLIFFGDRCDEGGNDQPLAKEILKNHGVVYNVADYKETYKILQKLIILEQEG